MAIDNELIDNLLKDYKKPEDLMGENGLLKELTKRLRPSGFCIGSITTTVLARTLATSASSRAAASACSSTT